MKSRKLCAVFFVAFSLLSFVGGAYSDDVSIPSKVSAQEVAHPLSFPSLTFNGRAVHKDILFNFFYRSAFSNALPETINYLASRGYTEEEILQKVYPDLYPVSFYEKKVPAFFAINRWAMPVRVSFGSDKDVFSAFAVKGPGVQQEKPLDFFSAEPQLAAHLANTLAKIKSRTGIDISLLEALNSAPSTKSRFGRIHIVLSDDIPRKEGDALVWKQPPHKEVHYHYPIKDPTKSVEEPKRVVSKATFPHPVIFTPNSDKQVDGFFVTNERNEIQFSICYLPSRILEGSLKMNLLDECLVRSMGLPDPISNMATELDPPSILSYWQDKDKWHARIVAYHRGRDSLDIQGLSALDMLLLEVLYNPSIHPGMGVKDVYKLFFN